MARSAVSVAEQSKTKTVSGLVPDSIPDLTPERLTEIYRFMYLAPDRRPRDHAQAPAEDILSDLRRRS